MTVRVVLEVAAKRSFASAVDWPGWARSGRSPEAALHALVEAGPRYGRIAEAAGVTFATPHAVDDVAVVERLRGSSSTEFGVPGAAARIEEEPLGTDLDRLVALLRASWAAFDDACRSATGRRLSRGPRGGGRDRSRIVEHVLEAERAYLSKLGARVATTGDPPAAERLELVRAAMLEALAAIAAGDPVTSPSRTQKLWAPRYAVRRSAWHAVDHAWEIEDRITPAG